MRRRRLIIAATVTLGVVAGITATGVAQAASRRDLAGSVPGWANAAALQGTAPATDQVNFRVYLGWQNEDAATALATAVSTPGSASYRQFLTPQQFRARFAPTQADVSAVQKWLRDAGFTVGYTPQNGHYVAAEGTVAQAQAAFGATIGLYSSGGLTLHAPESVLSVPASLSAVTDVVGLDDSAALVAHAAPPSPAFVNGRPCSAYWGEKTTTNTATPDGTALPGSWPYAVCGTTPAQLQSAYGISSAIASGNNGAGQTVAIIDAYASPTIAADANEYASLHGLPTMNGG
jgi:subtilase family serine protease